jgi:peptide deformylase
MYATRGIGLSANQVGLIMPILVMDTTSIEGGTLYKEFVNPRIVEHSEETSMQREGCLSFPGVFVNVKRFDSVVVEAEHKNGETFTVVADGIDAVCLQHEIDHLHGITFYDRLSPTAKRVHAAKFKKLKKWKRKNNLE